MKRRIGVWAVSIGLLLAAAGCDPRFNPARPAPPGAPPSDLPSAPPPPIEGDFLVGVENVPHQRLDAIPKLLPAFRKAGIDLVGRNSLRWSHFEPQAPQGGQHRYVFDALDREFRIYAKAGVQLQVTFLCRSSWGTQVPERELKMDIAGSPPRPEHWQSFGRAIGALVERYDGDGDRDAFPLDRPLIRILNIQEEVELAGHWAKYGGTPENYGRLLATAHLAAKEADPSILVGRAGASVGTFFDLGHRPGSIPAKGVIGDAYTFLRYSLANPVPYDLFSMHANRSYTGVAPYARFVREEMKKAGYERGLMIDDAASVNAVKPEEPCHSAESVRVLRVGDPEGLVRHQTAHTLKIAAVAYASGIQCVLFTGFVDVTSSPYKQIRHGGFVDTERFQQTRKLEGAVRPVLPSLAYLYERIRACDGAEFLDGFPDGTWVVRFRAGAKTFHVAWAHEESTKVELETGTSAATVLELTGIGSRGTPPSRTVQARGGKVDLVLGPDPVLVE